MERHLGRLIAEAARKHGHRTATRVARAGGWRTKTYAQFVAEIEAFGRVLIDRDVQPGDRVAIFAGNRPEWSVADFAILTIGAVVVPIYQTSSADQVQHIVSDSGAEVVVVGGQAELDVVHDVWPQLPDLRLVVAFDPVADEDDRVLRSFELLTVPSSPDSAGELNRRRTEASPDDLASIIYTSGTTAVPKGVMLTHRGFTDQVTALQQFFTITPEDNSLCFLPLAHALERAWTFVVFAHGCMNTYCTDPKAVAAMLVQVRPTLLASVPRLFEKVYSVAHERASGSKAKKRIFDWALKVGARAQGQPLRGRKPGRLLAVQLRLADRLVLSNIRDAIGGQKTVLASGGAALRKEIEEFFSAAGVLVCQGYGLTECSPLVSFNSPSGFKFGTVGRVMPGSEVRIDAEGQILYRGPNLMTGYWRDPEATAVVLVDGWLHTGDIGNLDGDGYLSITDRMKDIIVTANGKNIAPGPIENELMADPLIETAVLLGDGRPFVTLLVHPSPPDLEALARRLQLTWTSLEEMISHPTILAEMRARVSAKTARLASYEKVKDIRLLIEEFTVDNGLLTPTLKVKRREVEKRFAAIIEDMYASLTSRRDGS